MLQREEDFEAQAQVSGNRWSLWVTRCAGNEALAAASFIFHLDLFFSLFMPSFVHVLMLQDLAVFLAVLAGTREADGSSRLVKRDKRLVGRCKDENFVILLVKISASALQPFWLICSICAPTRFCREHLPLQDFLDETE